MNVHLVSLGCPKNQVDAELMLGLLAAGRGGPGGRGRGRRLRRRQHLRVHRPGKQESIETILELAAWKEPRRPAGAWSSPAACPSATAPSSSGRCPRSTRSWARASCRGSWTWSAGWTRGARLGASAPPGYVYDADDAARAPRPRALRLREDRRGLQHGLHLLRDPAHARAAPEPRAGRRGDRGRGARPRRRPEVVLVSQDTLAWGRDLPGGRTAGLRRSAPGALRDGDPLAPLPLPASRRTSPTGSSGSSRRRARSRTSTCRSSTPTTRSSARCAAA